MIKKVGAAEGEGRRRTGGSKTRGWNGRLEGVPEGRSESEPMEGPTPAAKRGDGPYVKGNNNFLVVVWLEF